MRSEILSDTLKITTLSEQLEYTFQMQCESTLGMLSDRAPQCHHLSAIPHMCSCSCFSAGNHFGSQMQQQEVEQ